MIWPAPVLGLDQQKFSWAERIFRQMQLTDRPNFVILMGFARKSEEFCLNSLPEAAQVVCIVDDGPKTDWSDGLVALQGAQNCQPVQVGNKFK